MKLKIIGFIAQFGLLAALSGNLLAEQPEPESASRHVDAARLIAGTEFAPVAEGYLCLSPENAGKYLAVLFKDLVDKTDLVQSGAAFDNLFYVGRKFVGTWVLKTDDGLILFDAMFNEGDAREVVVAGIRKLGLNPAAIKHVVITHGHFDHYGGARYLQKTYGAKVWSSEADWQYMEEHKNEPPPAVLSEFFAAELPLRDAVADDGVTLELGGETVQFVLTPGHTPGTVSAVISVLDKGVRRYVTIWGGTAMPKDSAGVRQMHASLLKLWRAGQDVGAEGVISTHAFVEDSLGRFARNEKTANNLFNLGSDGYNRMMAIHSECILAQAARYQAWGQ